MSSKEYIVSQCADDTKPVLDGSKEALLTTMSVGKFLGS